MSNTCCSDTPDFLDVLEDKLSQASPSVRAEYAAALKAGSSLATRRAVLEVAGRHTDIFSPEEREALSGFRGQKGPRVYISTSYLTEPAPDDETLKQYAREANTAAGILTSMGYSVFSPVSVRYAVASPFFDRNFHVTPEPLDSFVWRQNCLPVLEAWADRLLLLTTPEWLDDKEIKQEILTARAAGIPIQMLSADALCAAGDQVFRVMEQAPVFLLSEDTRDMTVDFILHVYREELGVPLPHLEALVDCLGLKAVNDLLEEWGNRALKNKLRIFAAGHEVFTESAKKDFLSLFPLTFSNSPEQGKKPNGGHV